MNNLQEFTDLEDIETSAKGLSVIKYRDFACDTFFKAFYLF